MTTISQLLVESKGDEIHVTFGHPADLQDVIDFTETMLNGRRGVITLPPGEYGQSYSIPDGIALHGPDGTELSPAEGKDRV